MQRAAIYARVSTPEQCLENQLYDLREMASCRGCEIVHEYTDVGSGSKARRAGPAVPHLAGLGRLRKSRVPTGGASHLQGAEVLAARAREGVLLPGGPHRALRFHACVRGAPA